MVEDACLHPRRMKSVLLQEKREVIENTSQSTSDMRNQMNDVTK